MIEDGLVPLLRRVCRWCGAVFGVCRSCFRGQHYCGDGCRKEARAEGHRESNRKHQRTQEGRDDHRDRQRDYRNRLKDRGVTDQSCAGETALRSLSTAEEGGEEEWDEAGQPDSSEPPQPRELFESQAFCCICGRRGFFVEPGKESHGVVLPRAQCLDRGRPDLR